MLKLKITDFNIFFWGGGNVFQSYFFNILSFFCENISFFSADLISLTIHEMLQQLI